MYRVHHGLPVSQQGDAGGRRANGLLIERVSPQDWEEIVDWDEAVAESASPSIFLTRDWISAWWDSFGAGLNPWLLRVADRDARTIGIAPLYVGRLRVGARRVGVLGDQVVGSEYLGIAARSGAEAEVADAVSGWLADAQPRWHIAEFRGLRKGDPAAGALELAVRDESSKAEVEEEPCSAIELPTDFEELLAGLRSKFRQSYRQRTNKLLRTCEVRFFPTESEAELREHLETLFSLHQRRWTEAQRLGAFADPRMRRFYDDVSRRLLRSGSLRFWHLEVDGAIRASQFAFVYDGVLHSLQEAYDMDFSAPGIGGLGVVLRGHVLRSAIEEGLRSYDFLGGAEDHKLRWGASIHSIRHLTVARGGVPGLAGWLETAGVAAVRGSLKEALPDSVLERLRATRATLKRRRARTG